ncbi:MAG: sensor histidine kinase [Ginsengibacter sp.]
MLAIKYYKDWYIKQRDSEILLRENKQAELQLLKAQVHPHFLFNTLNNIYSFTLTGHPRAANLVDKLSGMIDYMCTEGEKSFVPLVKEIQLVQDYIDLEKVRYGARLDMQIEINGDYENKIIAPLLMIPFVENCFKHGASKMRGRQWIKLVIDVQENELNFNLSNSKPKETLTTSGKKNIGLINVQKRLQLLYPENHILNIESSDEAYQVHLRISLHENEAIAFPNNFPTIFETKTISYV